MKSSNNEKVQNFLNDLKVVDPLAYSIVLEIRDIIFKVHPEVDEKMMYGGIVFFNKDEMFSGLFARKNHITLEFSNGYLMKDPDNFLEGKGKYRRHLKILNKRDIVTKQTANFIKQAI